MRNAHTHPLIVGALVLLALFCSGCAKERAQAASDARAGIAAAQTHADPIGQAILSGVDARLPAAADVNSADWPSPAMASAAISADPQKYISAAPPEPSRGWAKIAAITTAIGLPLLFTIGRLAPAIPGFGPAAGAVANIAWGLLAHKDLKAADEAKETVAGAAGDLLVIAKSANAHPRVVEALQTLAAG